MLHVLLAVSLSSQPQQPSPAPELDRFVLIQAAPGTLLDLIDLSKKRIPVIAAGGDEVPYIVRHFAEASADPIRPRLREGQSSQVRENVDPAWWQADLVDDAFAREVGL